MGMGIEMPRPPSTGKYDRAHIKRMALAVICGLTPDNDEALVILEMALYMLQEVIMEGGRTQPVLASVTSIAAAI